MADCGNCGTSASSPVFSKAGYDLVRCEACGLAYIANPPTAAQLAEIYSGAADYHVELQQPGSATWRRMDRIARGHLDFLGRVARNGQLLDVGCSTGQFIGLAHRAGFTASGIEFSPESADFAQRHFGLPVQPGSIHDATHDKGGFDVVTMFDVIEHVPDPLADMVAIFGLLKPGGWFVLSTPNIDGLFPRLSYRLARRLDFWPHPEPPHHLFQFSVTTLSAMLEKAGFLPGPIRHSRIDLAYTFGSPATLARMPKRLAYALAMAPLALAGPWFGSGDWFYVAAQKPA